MGEPNPEKQVAFENLIVGLYNMLYEDDLTTEDIEFYELEEDHYEGEIYLPYVGLNVELWQDWSTAKRIEVLIHEFAHTENYEDDHHPDFWERVVELTEIAIVHEDEIETLFGSGFRSDELKRTVIDSIHEHVIETDIDTVPRRKKAVSDALQHPLEETSTD